MGLGRRAGEKRKTKPTSTSAKRGGKKLRNPAWACDLSQGAINILCIANYMGVRRS